MMRSLLAALVVVMSTADALPAHAEHPIAMCGVLTEHRPPPSDDPPSGLGTLSIRGGDGRIVTFLFHHSSGAATGPSTTAPGAATIGASVCFEGTHAASASPVRSDYVTAYRLTLRTPATLPSTSTSGACDEGRPD